MIVHEIYIFLKYFYLKKNSKVKVYDNSLVCGLVWNINYIAYRCRTCALSPCMSICAECFKNGNHEGHDFNMFKSGAGGACDCGKLKNSINKKTKEQKKCIL